MINLGLDAGNGAFKIYGPQGGQETFSQVAINGGQRVVSTMGLKRMKTPLHIKNSHGAFYIGAGAHDYGRPVENLDVDRFNGLNQVSYLVTTPTFSLPPQPPGNLRTTSPTIYKINPELHAPYVMQTAVSLERQITKSANLAVSYLNSRGVHQFYKHNINAPVGSTDPNDPTVRPLGNLNNVYPVSYTHLTLPTILRV